MSITRTETFPCRCGELLTVEIVDSLNAERHPLLRAQVIDRSLHTAHCTACDGTLVVENDFLYVDLARREVLGVFPRNERDNADACVAKLHATVERWFMRDAPAWIQRLTQECLIRICFSLEELREKLVAHEAGIDDTALELLKCVLLAQDPHYYQAAEVVTLRLDRVDADTLDLIAVNIHDMPLGDRIQIPRTELANLPMASLLTAFPGVASGAHVSMLRLGRRVAAPE